MKYSNSTTIPASTSPTRKPLTSSHNHERSFLRGELKPSFQPESVVVETQAQHFADQEQEEQI